MMRKLSRPCRRPEAAAAIDMVRQRTASMLLLCRADQYSDAEHDGAAEHDLEHGVQERRVHVARTDEGDCPQLEEHDNAGDCGGDPERVRPGIWHQIRNGVAEAAE